MAAAVRRRKVPLILNVPNRGAIGGLRDDDVVEVTCLADEHGAHPIAQGEIPEAVLALLAQVKLYERLTVTAAVKGSYDAARGALLAHPLVASYPAAEAILDEYIERLAGLLPTLTWWRRRRWLGLSRPRDAEGSPYACRRGCIGMGIRSRVAPAPTPASHVSGGVVVTPRVDGRSAAQNM